MCGEPGISGVYSAARCGIKAYIRQVCQVISASSPSVRCGIHVYRCVGFRRVYFRVCMRSTTAARQGPVVYRVQ